MKFLHPNFLWALLFLAIPIIIHLFYFRRYKRVLFSNTKFLTEIKEEKATKNKLKHLLILLSRLLAVLFLVFAFAQPFIPQNKATNISEKLISVYIDNSFSMQAEGNGFLLFDEAKTSAEKIIEAYAENNKFQILTNDFEAKHQRIVGKSEALNLLEVIKVSAASQSKELVFEKQKNSAKSFDGQKIVYQISDFQLQNELFEADTTISTNLIKLQPSNIRNLSIEEVYFDAPVQLKGQNNKLLVKIKNQSEEEQSGSFQLTLNGVAKSLGNYTIPANDYIVDTLQFTITDANWNLGKISLNDYPLTFDDNYFFSFFVEDKMNVYCIFDGNGEKYPKAVFIGNTQVTYSSSNVNTIDYSVFDEQHLIIVSNLKNLPTGLNEALKSYINGGGQVFIIPNEEASIPSYNQFLNSLGIGNFTQKSTSNRKVANINLQQELINDIFDETPTNLKLPSVSSYFVLSSNVKQNSIMSFADGTNYLSSSNVANGNLYLLTSSLNASQSDFSQLAMFAPMVYKMAVLGVKNINIAYPIEANTNIQLSKLPKNAESLLRISNDKSEIIPQKTIYNGAVLLNLPGNQLESGYYKVTGDEEDYSAKIALNYNRAESNLSYYSKEDLIENYSTTKVQILENNLAVITDNVKLLEDGKSFWKICIILALLFLAIEILLLKFLPN